MMVSVGKDTALTPALLDTGAEMSCLSQEMYDRLKQEGNVFHEFPVCNVNIVTAMGGKSKRIGKQVLLPIVCQGVHMEVNCLVVPKLLKNLVLGNDWMESYQVTISYANETEPGVVVKEYQLHLRDGRTILAVVTGEAMEADTANIKQTEGPQALSLCGMSCSRGIRNSSEQQESKLGGGTHQRQQRELTETQHAQLQNLLTDFDNVFSDVPGKAHVYTHRLEEFDDSPFCGRTYPVAHAHREAVQRAINKMLEADVIERSDTNYTTLWSW